VITLKKIILIKYGELTTKKANRNLFVNRLYENVVNKLKDYQVKIVKNRVRMFIETEDNIEEILDKLKTIFGIHRIVVAYQVNTNIEDIKESVLDIVKDIDFTTFKVETKRSDKKFPIDSMEFNHLIGGLVLKNIPNKKVDVHNPDYLLKIEIREDYTYIYSKEVEGAGGYPVGVAGKGLLMISGGIDSPVAGYMAMKRGIKIEAIYFESPPHTSLMAKNKVKSLVEKLTDYQGEITLHVINFTEIQEAIYKYCDPNYMITIMRRMMYRISERVMERNKDLILINGESIGQVASQTLSSMQVINNVTNKPVVRPLACFDKLEIIDISKKIGTYDISILPYEDCCTIFLPKHPVINPKLEKAINEENKFDYNSLINNCIETMENIKIKKENKHFDI
jgi:thiamine biosynthesis protein ThiI